MKFITVFLVLLALTASTFASPLTSSQYELLFSRFVKQYGKTYNGIGLVSKYNTFVENLNDIIKHNQGKSSFTMAMNRFGDLTTEEFKAIHTGYIRSNKAFGNKKIETFNSKSVRSVESQIDWREKGVVNPIKDQGHCGSCWTFSSTASLESRYAIANNKLYDLSEQQLNDCSTPYGNIGCRGGLMNLAYDYYIGEGGACETKDYPYIQRDSKCQKTCKPVVQITGYTNIPENREDEMLKAVNEGPISIGIAAGNKAFQFYSSGILDSPDCNADLDHAVAIVGYGTENGKDYWIVRNSWGTVYGEKGYLRIVRNKNMCGLSLDPIFPNV